MQVKSIAEREHSAILLTFIKLPFVFKTCFVYFEWSLKTGLTVETPVRFFSIIYEWPIALYKCLLVMDPPNTLVSEY